MKRIARTIGRAIKPKPKPSYKPLQSSKTASTVSRTPSTATKQTSVGTVSTKAKPAAKPASVKSAPQLTSAAPKKTSQPLMKASSLPAKLPQQPNVAIKRTQDWVNNIPDSVSSVNSRASFKSKATNSGKRRKLGAKDGSSISGDALDNNLRQLDKDMIERFRQAGKDGVSAIKKGGKGLGNIIGNIAPDLMTLLPLLLLTRNQGGVPSEGIGGININVNDDQRPVIPEVTEDIATLPSGPNDLIYS